mmetsp:Transcript_56546/g.131774  ORF Transcript_56546/g.131774 Transcript_56546/m.131774 type:complete len:443 (+) Transcript_56546:89-1417(+)
MALFRLTIALLALELAAAASSSTCPAAATGQQPKQASALLQKSVHRALKVDAGTSSNQTAAGECPWSATTKVDFQFQCVDGQLCDGFSCCNNKGGRAKCPPNRPFMCQNLKCTGGNHCCKEFKSQCMSSKHGGLRQCPSSGVCPYRGTTEVNDEMECADTHTCSTPGCCSAHGGIALCPANKPLMCDDTTCAVECSANGGMRSCMGQVTMIGNSFTHYNQGVDAVLRDFFSATGKPRDIVALTKGGANWSYHLSQANTAGTAHNVELQGSHHDFVVVQEQSYIPGTWEQNDGTFASSLGNLTGLDAKIAQLGAITVLYQTFGWRDGHGSRPYLSTFTKFNDEVAKGYEVYKAALAAGGRTPMLAPVGNAFKILHAEGHDSSSLWYRLFDVDAVHPSTLGSYLAGCVIYATITGEKPVGLPYGTLAEAEAQKLQAVADSAVFA